LINEGPAFGMADYKPSARAKHARRIAACSRLICDVAVHAIHEVASTLVQAKSSEAMSVW
jgi:hypothetical protein